MKFRAITLIRMAALVLKKRILHIEQHCAKVQNKSQKKMYSYFHQQTDTLKVKGELE